MSALGNEGAPQNQGQGSEEGGAPAFDFERSYNELRPEYTRATQELSTTRERLGEYESLFAALHDSDPAVQAQAMEYMGLELETGSPAPQKDPSEWDDPLEAEVAALKEEL